MTIRPVPTASSSSSSGEDVLKSRWSSVASRRLKQEVATTPSLPSAPKAQRIAWTLFMLFSLALFGVYGVNQVVSRPPYVSRPLELPQSAASSGTPPPTKSIPQRIDSNSYTKKPLAANQQAQIQHEQAKALLLKRNYTALPLELVHIPKTGGTSMEAAFARLGKHWGFCKFMNRGDSFRNSLGAVSCPLGSPPLVSLGTYQKAIFGYTKWAQGAMPWHLPPHRFEKLQPWENMYQNATLFAVVRNPYDRVVSEYYFENFVYRQQSPTIRPTAAHLNTWAQRILKERSKFLQNFTRDFQSNQWNQGYGGHGGHWIPQAEYCFYNGRRYVQHILKFEDNLTHAFEELMQRYYNVSLTLPRVMTSASSVSSPGGKTATTVTNAKDSSNKLTRRDFQDSTKQMIELIFAQDFEAFEYVKESTGNRAAADLWASVKLPPAPPKGGGGTTKSNIQKQQLSRPNNSNRQRRRLRLHDGG